MHATGQGSNDNYLILFNPQFAHLQIFFGDCGKLFAKLFGTNKFNTYF